MDRWACVSLAAWPLQIMARSRPEWRALPSVVVSEDKPQGKVQWANRSAREAGVLPGHSYALALSLCNDLRACVVSDQEIAAVTAEVKTVLWDFSPSLEVSDEPGVFWLDASGLGQLYVSLSTWSAQLRERVQKLGFHACVVVGFSRFGTYALARAERHSRVLRDIAEEQACVERTPLACLDIEPEFRDVLHRLGVFTVAQLIGLPATGLLTRFGKTAARLHALACRSNAGFAPLQAEQWLMPLLERTLLDNAESDSTRLLFIVKSMLTVLLKRLVVRGEACTGVQLRCVLDRKQGLLETEPLKPAVPTLDSGVLSDLLRLRMESLQLAAGAIEVELEATGVPASAEQLQAFAERPRRDPLAAQRAIARLRAEFGPQSVVHAVLCDGLLPEASFSWQAIETLPQAAAVSSKGMSLTAADPRVEVETLPLPLTLRPLVRRVFKRPETLSAPTRELRNDGWLIRGAEHGPVTHTAGPFLLNGGWWIKEIQREYQFILTRRGALLWVYQDRRRRRWFLHGQVQ